MIFKFLLAVVAINVVYALAIFIVIRRAKP